jgi:hypothetical protein
MMTIQQTVAVPDSRNVHFDVTLPDTLPRGPVHIFVRFVPADTSPTLENEPAPDDIDEFYGCFKGKGVWQGDSVAVIRKMRDEW